MAILSVEIFERIYYYGIMSQNSSTQAQLIFKKYLPVFSALGDPVRQKIMFLLASKAQLSVHEVADQTTLSRPAVSHHLKILREAGLVQAQRDGVRLYYTPRFETPYQMSQDFTQVLENIIKRKEEHAERSKKHQ